MTRRDTARLRHRWCPALALAAAALGGPDATAAQTASPPPAPPRVALQATPKGALPPAPLPMPASRNHNYLGLRLQAGQQRDGRGAEVYSAAAGIDWQLRGGSVLGFTGGYQEDECVTGEESCGGHVLLEMRGRFGLLTGGPSLGELFGDYSATAVLGLELGVGFAPNIAPDLNACTVDLGAPMSLSMLQTIRLVTFITPALAWNIDCSTASPPNDASFVTGFGVALQQLGLRGLDVSVGVQKIFETGTGYQLGISVSYVRIR